MDLYSCFWSRELRFVVSAGYPTTAPLYHDRVTSTLFISFLQPLPPSYWDSKSPTTSLAVSLVCFVFLILLLVCSWVWLHARRPSSSHMQEELTSRLGHHKVWNSKKINLWHWECPGKGHWHYILFGWMPATLRAHTGVAIKPITWKPWRRSKWQNTCLLSLILPKVSLK